MNRKLLSLKAQLASEHYIMNDDWLKECVEYFLNEEHQGVAVADAKTLSFVREQWMLRDLREISNQNGSLPANIKQKKVTILPGNLILQVDKYYDISTPKFKQLDNIRRVSNVNIEVTEQTDNNQPAEPKAKRMMYLHLTDGIQDITAMEYKLIPCLLEPPLIAGYKLLIKGPIICRNGVLLLEPKNIPEMGVGGEVDTMINKNAPENVLARALGLPENPDPYGHSNPQPSENPVNLYNMDVDQDAKTVTHECGERRHEKTSGNDLDNIQNLDRTMSDLSMEIPDSYTESKSVATKSSAPSSCTVSKTTESRDFGGDSDEEWMSMIDESKLNVIGAKPNTSNQSPAIEKPKSPLKSPTIPHCDSDMFDDFVLDEDIIEQVEKIEDIPCKSSYFNSSLKPKSAIVDLTKESPKQSPKKIDKSPSLQISQESFNMDFPEIDIDNLAEIENAEFGKYKKLSPKKSIKPAETITRKQYSPGSTKSPNNFPIFNKNPPVAITPTKSPGSQRKPQVSPLTNSAKITSKIPKPNTNSANKKITDFIVKKDGKPILNLKDEYDSIADIKAKIPTRVLEKMRVFGRTVEIAKLKREKMLWDLKVTISDDKDTIETKFSNEVMEKLIGYSVMNVHTLKSQGPEGKEMLRKALKRADNSITNFKGIFDIELLPNENYPKVTKLTHMTK